MKRSSGNEGTILTLQPSNYPTGGYFEAPVFISGYIAGDELVALAGTTISSGGNCIYTAFSFDSSKNYVCWVNNGVNNSGTWSNVTATGTLANIKLGSRYGNTSITGLLDEPRIYAGILSRVGFYLNTTTRTHHLPSMRLGNETANNAAPNTPTNSTPMDTATGVSRNPTLTASAFSDSDVGDTHAASQWQIFSDAGLTSKVWDSGRMLLIKPQLLSIQPMEHFQERYLEKQNSVHQQPIIGTFDIRTIMDRGHPTHKYGYIIYYRGSSLK